MTNNPAGKRIKSLLPRAVALLIIFLLAYFLNKTGILQKALDWIAAFGPWAPVLFLAVYVLTVLFFVPSFVFTFSSGALFGAVTGTVLSALGNALGSVLALAAGRYLARDFTAKRFAAHAQFKKIDDAIRKKGWKIILLSRLSPIFPFSIANYALGLTAIPAKDYFFASLAGTLPSAGVYSYLGAITGNLAALGSSGREKTPAEWGLLIVGLGATVALSIYLKKISQAALAEEDLR